MRPTTRGSPHKRRRQQRATECAACANISIEQRTPEECITTKHSSVSQRMQTYLANFVMGARQVHPRENADAEQCPPTAGVVIACVPSSSTFSEEKSNRSIVHSEFRELDRRTLARCDLKKSKIVKFHGVSGGRSLRVMRLRVLAIGSGGWRVVVVPVDYL